MTHNERVLDLLSDGEPHSHLELYNLHVIAHSRIADLRKQGHRIMQWRDGDLYFYRLLDDWRDGDLHTHSEEPTQLALVAPTTGAPPWA